MMNALQVKPTTAIAKLDKKVRTSMAPRGMDQDTVSVRKSIATSSKLPFLSIRHMIFCFIMRETFEGLNIMQRWEFLSLYEYTFFFIGTTFFGSAWFVLKFLAIFRLKVS